MLESIHLGTGETLMHANNSGFACELLCPLCCFDTILCNMLIFKSTKGLLYSTFLYCTYLYTILYS